MAYDEKLADRVRAVLKGRREVAERRLMGHLAFLVNGAMCCSVGPEGILFRIDPAEQERVLDGAGVTAMQMGGRTMKGFVRVAPAAFRTEAALAQWVEGGIAAGADRKRAPKTGTRRKAPAGTAKRKTAKPRAKTGARTKR